MKELIEKFIRQSSPQANSIMNTASALEAAGTPRQDNNKTEPSILKYIRAIKNTMPKEGAK